MTDATAVQMNRIHELLGDVIAAATRACSVPPAFLAGIVANESGGNPNVSRFEPAIFQKLQDVLAGRKAEFKVRGMKRPLGRNDLLLYVDPGAADKSLANISAATSFTDKLRMLEGLATSWGLTQLMGWHALELAQTFSNLKQPRGNLDIAVVLLAWFAQSYSLDVTKDFSELLHCWNTGTPDPAVPTYDPHYVANGLARMTAYEAVLAAAATK